MNTFKEYPATHSMETNWYCIDEDGNVGVFDIDDNGPVPTGNPLKQASLSEFLYYLADEDECGIKCINLTDDQVKDLLIDDNWEKEEWDDGYNYYWNDVALELKPEFVSAFISKVKELDLTKDVYCLSKSLNIFFVDFSRCKAMVDYMDKLQVIKAIYRWNNDNYSYFEDGGYNADGTMTERMKSFRFPAFVYFHDTFAQDPAEKKFSPKHPWHVSQLTEKQKSLMGKLPLRFAETDKIQLAEHVPVDAYLYDKIYYNRYLWGKCQKADGSYFYLNSVTSEHMSEENMLNLMKTGEAFIYDYQDGLDIIEKQYD